MEIIAVIVICDNVVENTFAFTDSKKAEVMFKSQALELNSKVTEDEIEDALANGYYETSDKTICITDMFAK